MKKILSVLLSLAMLLSCVSISQAVLADDALPAYNVGDSFDFHLNYTDECFETSKSVQYATFTPEATGFYEFVCEADTSADICLAIWDENGRFLEESFSLEDATNQYVIEKLDKGKRYQIGFRTFCDGFDLTGTVTIVKHTHIFETVIHAAKQNPYKPTEWKDGAVTNSCTRCFKYEESTPISAPNKIKAVKTTFTYNGKKHTPQIKVYDSKGKVIAASNYKINTGDAGKNVGIYGYSIDFNNKYYNGSLIGTYKIVPKGTTIKSVTANKKGFTVKWKKQATQVTGYQIQYSTDKNFKKNNKTITVKSNKTLSKKVTKLKAKKKYYVRVRTYKKDVSTKLCSSWSKAKSVKTK